MWLGSNGESKLFFLDISFAIMKPFIEEEMKGAKVMCTPTTSNSSSMPIAITLALITRGFLNIRIKAITDRRGNIWHVAIYITAIVEWVLNPSFETGRRALVIHEKLYETNYISIMNLLSLNSNISVCAIQNWQSTNHFFESTIQLILDIYRM